MSPVKTLKPAVASDADVFSISDAHLAQRYRFIREVCRRLYACFNVSLCGQRIFKKLFIDWRGELGMCMAVFSKE